MKSLIKIPEHIGIILDGNGRWAKRKGLTRLAGHKEGINALYKTVMAAKELGIKIISVFAFSTENWKRDKEEVDGIFNLIDASLTENFEKIVENGVQVRVMGDISKLDENLAAKISNLVQKTKNNSEIVFNVGLNYGSKDEILRAVNLCHEKYAGKEISREMFENELYTNGLPDPDLIIRTSGELRLSNFMLYQSAYSEFYFPKVYWPDFNKKQLLKAVKVYSKRNRRFGNV